MSYLGLDVGTTGCKAVVFDESGRQTASAYRGYPIISGRDGWAEVDSALVCESCMAVIKEAAGSSADPVCGMAISSQGEAFTPVGPDGAFLGNGMVSSDSRAAAIAEGWSERFGRQKLYQITGHTAASLFTLFKLVWLRDNQPDVWSRASKFYCFEDLIHLRLGLDPAISWPLAGRTLMFNVRTHQWDDEVLSDVGLDKSKLARTLAAGEVVGTVPLPIARELGLSDHTIVVAGGHDQTCGALGVGVVSPGRAAYSMGTAECITPAFDEAIFSEELFRNNLATYDFTVPGMYTTVAYSITGGNLLQWFRDTLGGVEVAEAKRTGASAYELLLGNMADKPTSLMVLPYFTASGTPYFDTETRGAILGLRMTTRRADIMRALLEGVTFEMRLNVDILGRSGIPVDELVAFGGGARSSAWVQLKADIFNKHISCADVNEAGCMGAAMLAKSADIGESVTQIARDWVRITQVIEPNAENAAYYDNRFESYQKLYPALRDLEKEI